MLCEDSKIAAVLKINFAISFAVAAFIPPYSNHVANERLRSRAARRDSRSANIFTPIY
jgi:hypothetical protein